VRAKVEALLASQVPNEDSGSVIGGTVGVAAYPEDAQDSENLVRLADEDMYTRKRAARIARGEPATAPGALQPR
jgi:predicted signal transduction protein with EAL and GGDEF domain